MKNLHIIRIFLFLSCMSLKASEISLSFKLEDYFILERLQESGIIKQIDFTGDKDTVITFEEDFGKKIFSFRSNRKKELSFLREEQVGIQNLLGRQDCSCDKTDKDRSKKLEEFKDFYSKIISEREREEPLSFLDFLALYVDKKEKLLEDIKNTNNRVSS